LHVQLLSYLKHQGMERLLTRLLRVMMVRFSAGCWQHLLAYLRGL
jgi:hypothetical protein